eukprot:scaffold218535_cov21-Tisochrysis_lutea.AAC.1
MGGYMLFDDYLWPTKGAPSSWPCSPASSSSPDHPKLGIDHFLSTMGAELEVIHKGYQVLVRKVVQGPCYPFHVEPGTIQACSRHFDRHPQGILKACSRHFDQPVVFPLCMHTNEVQMHRQKQLLFAENPPTLPPMPPRC